MLKGEKVILRPVEERDLDLIVRWRNHPNNRRFFFSSIPIYPGGQKKWYEDLMVDQNRIVFMIDRLEGKTVGMIAIDNIDWHNRECEGGQLVVDPDERRLGFAEEAAHLLAQYAFEELNMHRAYVVIFPFNPTIDLVKKMGFKEEGRLREAVYSGGKYHDKVILGMLREEWMDAKSRKPTDA
jgi:RimJ/RimL family protein N-acetyltransferase